MKIKKIDTLISVFLIIITIGFAGLAEFVHRVWQNNPLSNFFESDFWVFLGILLVFLGFVWIWWTGHLIRAVAVGFKLKFYFPLTFCRNSSYAALLYSFYPASALIFNRAEMLVTWVFLLLISHLILFRIPYKREPESAEDIEEEKLSITLPETMKHKNELLIHSKAMKEQAKILQPDCSTPCKYLIYHGKSAQIAEIFIYIFVFFWTLDLLFNPITDTLSDTFRIIAGSIWIIATTIWILITHLTYKQYDPSKVLILAGTFRFCRHPLYAGILYGIYPSLIIILNSLELLIGFPILLIAVHSITREEEYYLYKLFGEDWANFASTRPRFFPFLLSHRKDAALIRRDFASTALIVACVLTLISVGFFILTLLNIFSANPESPIINLMPYVLIAALVITLPSWEYWKKICFTVIFSSVILLVCFMNHKSESIIIKDEIYSFFYNVQKPDVHHWQFNINGAFNEDGKYSPSKQFIEENEFLLYALRTGTARKINDFRMKSFILPFRSKNFEVEIEIEPDVGSSIIYIRVMKTPTLENNINKVVLPRYQLASLSTNRPR